MWVLKKEFSTNNFFFQSISATEVTALSVYFKKKKKEKNPLRGTLRQESQFTEWHLG